MTLYISVQKPSQDLEKCAMDTAITNLAAHVALEKRNGSLDLGPAVDITFMLPYKNLVPPFQGMRMGGFTNENQTLYFEISVPEHLVNAKSASRYVIAAIQDAVDNAGDFFSEHNIEFDLEKWHQTAMRLIAATSTDPMSN